MKTSKTLPLILLISLLSGPARPEGIYVATSGDDSGAGTIQAPLRTIAKAAGVAQAGDSVWIRGGVYRESVSPKRNGTQENPIVFNAYPGEEVVISGGDLVTGWIPSGDRIWEAPMQSSLPDYHPGYNYPAADQRHSIHANSLHLKGSADDGVEQVVTSLPQGDFIFSAYVRLVEPDAPGADVYLSVHWGDNEIAGTWASSVQLRGDQTWRMVKVPFRNQFEVAGRFTIRISKKGNGEAYVDNIGLVPIPALMNVDERARRTFSR